ncbi:uncharacterized protein BXZ73DRAFT_108349 [Epithele typhae]|uniref:uncharacterized protein n=1 Tax=Epithele typhae TaxID=378194 RepID=UPI0020083CEC|nr:uncharacterized protein BXZ73DRAFT_108349 [Epithele typhae]KAH9910923.1 hypothetical protein BXZ73DRAFT_108349 [Epithele typhae]
MPPSQNGKAAKARRRKPSLLPSDEAAKVKIRGRKPGAPEVTEDIQGWLSKQWTSDRIAPLLTNPNKTLAPKEYLSPEDAENLAIQHVGINEAIATFSLVSSRWTPSDGVRSRRRSRNTTQGSALFYFLTKASKAHHATPRPAPVVVIDLPSFNRVPQKRQPVHIYAAQRAEQDKRARESTAGQVISVQDDLGVNGDTTDSELAFGGEWEQDDVGDASVAEASGNKGKRQGVIHEIMKEYRDEWNNLSQEEQQPYIDAAQEETARRVEAMNNGDKSFARDMLPESTIKFHEAVEIIENGVSRTKETLWTINAEQTNEVVTTVCQSGVPPKSHTSGDTSEGGSVPDEEHAAMSESATPDFLLDVDDDPLNISQLDLPEEDVVTHATSQVAFTLEVATTYDAVPAPNTTQSAARCTRCARTLRPAPPHATARAPPPPTLTLGRYPRPPDRRQHRPPTRPTHACYRSRRYAPADVNATPATVTDATRTSSKKAPSKTPAKALKKALPKSRWLFRSPTPPPTLRVQGIPRPSLHPRSAVPTANANAERAPESQAAGAAPADTEHAPRARQKSRRLKDAEESNRILDELEKKRGSSSSTKRGAKRAGQALETSDAKSKKISTTVGGMQETTGKGRGKKGTSGAAK